MRSRSAWRLTSVLLCSALAGCGGLVVFVEDDGTGAGNEGGGSPGPGPGPGPGPTTSTSTSTGTMPTLCQQYCDVWGNCAGAECMSSCESLINGECGPEAAAYLGCFAGTPNNGCDITEDVCLDEYWPWAECLQGGCSTEECGENSDGTCTCFGLCGSSGIEQACYTLLGGDEPGGGVPMMCDCILDGNYIGSCDALDPCSIEGGCCADLIGQFE
jgi:hypothetical protein